MMSKISLKVSFVLQKNFFLHYFEKKISKLKLSYICYGTEIRFRCASWCALKGILIPIKDEKTLAGHWYTYDCRVCSWWPRRASGTRTGPRFRAAVTHRSAPPCSRLKTQRNSPTCTWRDGERAPSKSFCCRLHDHLDISLISKMWFKKPLDVSPPRALTLIYLIFLTVFLSRKGFALAKSKKCTPSSCFHGRQTH